MRRRVRWIALAGLTIVMIGAGAWAWLPSPSIEASVSVSVQPIGATPLDELTASRLERLRSDGGLDSDALACLNLSEAQLDTMLSALRSWWDGNAGVVLGKQSAIADKQAEIRSLRARIDAGPADPSLVAQLNTARAALSSHRSDYDVVLSQMRGNLTAALSSQQQALIARMIANRGVPMPYRILDLDRTEKKALAAARSRYMQRIGSIRDPSVTATIQQAHSAALVNLLGTQNMQELGNLAGYRAASSERVVQAVQRNLPVES